MSTVKLVGINSDKIIQKSQKLLDDEAEYDKMSQSDNPYGDGNACERVIKFIKEIE